MNQKTLLHKKQFLPEVQPVQFSQIAIEQCHVLDLPQCCPISRNPQLGSTVTIRYMSSNKALEVYSLKQYIDSFIGGKDNVRGMEDMIKQIYIDCQKVLDIPITVEANLILEPNQKMVLKVCQQ